VKGKNGARLSSPQAVLDNLLGPISFDPQAFIRMNPKAQSRILRELVGLDFTKEDEKRAQAYAARTEIGRDIKRLEGAISQLPELSDNPPTERVSVTTIAERLEAALATNAENNAKQARLAALRETRASLKSQIDKLNQQLTTINTEGKALAAEVEGLTDTDTAALRESMSMAEQTNNLVDAYERHKELNEELTTAVSKRDELTEYIAQIDQVKADATARVKYPIDGLEVDDDGVRLHGVPFEQASQAQQLRVSCAIGFALSPALKVLLVRDGSLLDETNLKLLHELATAHDGQVWLERVGDGSEGATVVIEDGEVKA
jgi:chromosome segregation ATPase